MRIWLDRQANEVNTGGMGFFKRHWQKKFSAIIFVITAAIASWVLLGIEVLSQLSSSPISFFLEPIYYLLAFLDSLPLGNYLVFIIGFLFNFIIMFCFLWLLLSLIRKAIQHSKKHKDSRIPLVLLFGVIDLLLIWFLYFFFKALRYR